MVKKKTMTESKTSVKYYQQEIESEKHKMDAYSKKFATTIGPLQAGFKKHAKDMNASALKIREDGITNMNRKVGKFNHEIKGQIQENKEAVSRIANNIKFFQSEINKKKNDFKAYAHGPFTNDIKSFHNKVDKEKKSFQAYARGPFTSYIKAFLG